MKEKILRKGITKRLFSVVLAVAMVVTLLPIGGITVYAANNYSDRDIVYRYDFWDEVWEWMATYVEGQTEYIRGIALGDSFNSCNFTNNGDGHIFVDGNKYTEGTVTGTLVKIEDNIIFLCNAHGDTNLGELCSNCTPSTCKVSFDANGGNGTMSDVTGVFGNYNLPACGFTASSEDLRFGGWATTSDGAKISGTTVKIYEDTTLYAIWKDAHVFEFDDLTVGTVVRAGDSITRDDSHYGWLYFVVDNHNYFGFGMDDSDNADYALNGMDSWEMKSEFPQYTENGGTGLPEWYDYITEFEVSYANKSPDGGWMQYEADFIPHIKSIALSKTETSIAVGNTDTLTVNFNPADIKDKTVIWTSDKEAVATVNNGIITAKTVGTATITATSNEGHLVATCEVTVTPAPTPDGGKVTIHRYLRPDKKDWLITCNEKEIENLIAAGWKDEGALGFVGTKDTGVEVIRFYNEITGDRMYTSNEKEKQNYRDAKKYGWIEEGVAFYTGNKAKIVRYTTPNLSHLWSVSTEEQSRLDAHESEGWKKEGVAFYLN